MGANESKVEPLKLVEVQKPEVFQPPENDYQLVFEAIKSLEHTLMANFDSSGDNLHEMISTTNQKLPLDLIIDMRSLATVRNNLAHEYSCDAVPDREDFIKKYQSCVDRLKAAVARRKEEDEKLYKEVVQKHRALHPRPAFVVEEPHVEEAIKPSPMCSVACF